MPTKITETVTHVSIKKTSITSNQEFTKILNHENAANNSLLGAITMHDINQAFGPKTSTNRDEVKKSLPIEKQYYTDLFLYNDIRPDEPLPAHRPGVDTKITIEKHEHGHEKEVPWGPLHGMS